MTLLQAVRNCLTSNGKTINDILWIGGDDVYIEKSLFIEIATSIEDNGFDSSVAYGLPINLVIVGTDFWIGINPSDDECADKRAPLFKILNYYTMPQKPEKAITISTMKNTDIPSYWEKNQIASNGLRGIKLIDFSD